MPVVPITEPNQITTQVRPGNRASGSDYAQTLSQQRQADTLIMVGNQLGDIATDMQLRENADRVMRAETDLKDSEREFTNVLNERKGAAAFGVTEEAETWWQDSVSRASETLTNDNQRQMFTELAEQRRQNSLDSVSSYEATQRRESFNQSADAVIKSSIAMAAASAFNPRALQLEKNRIEETLGDLAASNGWTPEITEARRSESLTAMHSNVLESLLMQSPQAARDYFTKNSEEIAGTVRAEMQGLIEAAELDHKALSLANQYYTDEASYDAAVDKVRKISDPDLQKATRSQVNAMYADAVTGRRETETKATDNGWKALAAGFHVNEIPKNDWKNIPGDVQIRMQEYDQAKVSNDIKPRTTDDYSVLDTVESQIEEGLITSTAQLAQYQPFFRRETFDTLRDSITKQTAGIPQDDIRTLYEERIGTKRAAGWNNEQFGDYVMLQEYVNSRVREGVKPADIETLVDRWFMEGYGLQDRALRDDPNTFAESYRAGRNDFVMKTPDTDQRLMQSSMDMLEAAGVPVGKDKTALDEFYTKVGFDARRYFVNEGITATPQHIAAYTVLQQNGQPITAANIEFVLAQMQ